MNPFGNFHRGGNGVHEISPDEIFNMFFKVKIKSKYEYEYKYNYR